MSASATDLLPLQDFQAALVNRDPLPEPLSPLRFLEAEGEHQSSALAVKR